MEDTAYHFQYRSYHMSHNHWNPKISAEKAAGVLRSLIGKCRAPRLQATEEMPEPETEEAPDILKSLGIEIPEKDIDFAALQEENSDVYAWIYVPGTNVDYPVLQHPDG